MTTEIQTIRSEIEGLISFLLEKELALSTNPPIIRIRGTEEFLTWSGAPERISDTFGQQFASIPEYYTCLDSNYYHVLLYDGGLLQFGYLFEDGIMTRHRLLYYPCPVQIPSDIVALAGPGEDFKLIFEGLAHEQLDSLKNDLENGTLAKSDSVIRARTPIRFDYSSVPAKSKTDHSLSHLHFNDSDCRWPVYGPLSVGSFVRFVFKSFYRSNWNEHESLRNWRPRHYTRTILNDEKADLFIESIA